MMGELTKEHILELIGENAGNLRQYGVVKLILFGSYARDEQSTDSDIDLLVEFQKGRGDTVDDFIGLLHFLEDLFNTFLKVHNMKRQFDAYLKDIVSELELIIQAIKDLDYE